MTRNWQASTTRRISVLHRYKSSKASLRERALALPDWRTILFEDPHHSSCSMRNASFTTISAAPGANWLDCTSYPPSR
jgi:hypothetical protein